MTTHELTAAMITAALRKVFPAPVHLSTRKEAGGDFTVTLPSASAGHLGIGRDHRTAEAMLTRDLGQPVHVAATRVLRADVRRGSRTEFTVRPGWCDGPACRAPHDPVRPVRPGEVIPGHPGYVAGKCGHRVAASEWRAGSRTCERCS